MSIKEDVIEPVAKTSPSESSPSLGFASEQTESTIQLQAPQPSSTEALEQRILSQQSSTEQYLIRNTATAVDSSLEAHVTFAGTRAHPVLSTNLIFSNQIQLKGLYIRSLLTSLSRHISKVIHEIFHFMLYLINQIFNIAYIFK